ncbi:MAG: hypothetical protein UR61_C0047G0010 [candidate division WS6 bacterium GW2011_GWE1_34_7]|uniref:Uncharacterized protein n=1 Tax=candidate division WS6 bacterium GW2011_GWE1_34_7 TaxID=1619093 RepID=A0A0G0B4N3_9BACT|nr:MAG: hypothetical protein UR61_C0047G0010 [candidate division WS6 bacterium GW2011_GWE1_34_7]
MKIYKTSNWRDIVEIEAIRVDENNVWLPKLKWMRDDIVERKLPRKGYGGTQYWDTIEEAKHYLTDKLNAEILRYEKQISKAKAIIEALK